jgi:hypothetical protein
MSTNKIVNVYVPFLFLSLLIVLYPINIRVFLVFRPVDIVLCISAVWCILFFGIRDRNLLALIILFYILFIVSMVYGLLFREIKNINSFVFFYKYFVVFSIFWITTRFSSNFREKQIKALVILCFLVLGVMVYHVYQFPNSPFSRNWVIRPSFPYSRINDSHIHGSYYSFMIIALLVCYRYKIIKINLLVFIAFVFVSVYAMLIVGARGGSITLGITSLLFFGLIFLEWVKSPKIKKKTLLFLTVFVCLSGSFILNNNVHEKNWTKLSKKINLRSFNYSYNAMARLRVRKINEGIDAIIVNGPVLIGIGLQSVPVIWWDNAFIEVLISAGLLGVMLLFTIIGFYLFNLRVEAIHNQRRGEFIALIFIFFDYIIINLAVAEFFLVSRSMIPFGLISGLIIALIRRPCGQYQSGAGLMRGIDFSESGLANPQTQDFAST